MSLVLALALQAVAPAPSSSAFVRIDFDLARYQIPDLAGVGARNCHRDDDPSAITVCARRGGGGYPLGRMERIYGPRHIVADTQVAGNLRGGFYMESHNLDPGQPASALPHNISNRITVGLRMPF
jgi:hypothetical protein